MVRRKRWTRWVAALCVACALGAGRADSPSDAVLELLNSRASGSYARYAEAAEQVAAEAKKGRAVFAYVLALISRERNAPPAARLDEATRLEYLEMSRPPIERAARQKNNPMALYLLSLEKGDTNLLARAAAAGNIQAQNAWGSYLFSSSIAGGAPSNVVARALKEAYGLFHKAAGKGDANGLYNLGMCLWRGLGVETDVRAAFNCFHSAALKGHPEAINNIGAFFRDGIVVEKDLEVATKWFAKSASYGNAYGQFNYALAFRRGEGVKQDYAAAVPLLEKSAEAGCVEAINAFGVALWKGEGTKEDAPRAFRLFMQAADAGYPPAMENLSTCYERGQGIKQDERKSIEWKIRSRAARGDPNALKWLRQNAGKK